MLDGWMDTGGGWVRGIGYVGWMDKIGHVGGGEGWMDTGDGWM